MILLGWRTEAHGGARPRTDRPRGAAPQGSPCPPPPPVSTTCSSWGCARGGPATSRPAAGLSTPSASSSASTPLSTSSASTPTKRPSSRGSSRPPPSGHGEWHTGCPPCVSLAACPRPRGCFTASTAPAWRLSRSRLRTVPGEGVWRLPRCRARAARGDGDGDGAVPRQELTPPTSSPQGVWLQGHHPVPQRLPAQRPGAQHRPPLARLRQPRHPAAALLHRGHAGEAAQAGCQGEGLRVAVSTLLLRAGGFGGIFWGTGHGSAPGC